MSAGFHSRYITRKESREAVGIAFLLGVIVGGFVIAVASAVMAGAGL